METSDFKTLARHGRGKESVRGNTETPACDPCLEIRGLPGFFSEIAADFLVQLPRRQQIKESFPARKLAEPDRQE